MPCYASSFFLVLITSQENESKFLKGLKKQLETVQIAHILENVPTSPKCKIQWFYSEQLCVQCTGKKITDDLPIYMCTS